MSRAVTRVRFGKAFLPANGNGGGSFSALEDPDKLLVAKIGVPWSSSLLGVVLY